MDLLRGQGDRFAVVDVETTGLYNRDRIVEIAVVTVSPHGHIVDEWDTLVNPERDVGPTHIHGVTASMVSAAPTFAEVNAALAERLHGSFLVAHNLPFDSRMIAYEFARTGGSFEPGGGICTLQLSGAKLEDACWQHGIPFSSAHRALADARASARLFRSISQNLSVLGLEPAMVAIPDPEFRPRTLRREFFQQSASTDMPFLARLADRTHHYGEHGAALVYMDLLDRAISDLVLTPEERTQLAELAIDSGLSPEEAADVRRRYLDELIEASLRDGVVDAHELDVLMAAAEVLGITDDYVQERIAGSEAKSGFFQLVRGTRICLTGTATYPDGRQLPRTVVESFAQKHGYATVKNVSKKGCDLLIAADPSSQSGKTQKARQFGIPVASVHDFYFLITHPGGPIRTT